MEDLHAVVQRLFVLAAQRIGGASALAKALDLDASEIKRYLAGEAVPPEDVLLRAVDLVLEDLKGLQVGISRETWRELFRRSGAGGAS